MAWTTEYTWIWFETKLYSLAVREFISVFFNNPSCTKFNKSGATSPLSLNLGTLPLLKSSFKLKHGDSLDSVVFHTNT